MRSKDRGRPSWENRASMAAPLGFPDAPTFSKKVEGRVRASSVRKISDLVDQHPEQAVNLIRQWVYQEQ